MALYDGEYKVMAFLSSNKHSLGRFMVDMVVKEGRALLVLKWVHEEKHDVPKIFRPADRSILDPLTPEKWKGAHFLLKQAIELTDAESKELFPVPPSAEL